MEPQRLADLLHAALDRALDAGPDISDLKGIAFTFTPTGVTVRLEPEGGTATDHAVSAADLAEALDEDLEPDTAPAAPPPAPTPPAPPATPTAPAAQPAA